MFFVFQEGTTGYDPTRVYPTPYTHGSTIDDRLQYSTGSVYSISNVYDCKGTLIFKLDYVLSFTVRKLT